MDNYRNRPKGNYIQEAQWQDLQILTQHWQKDLDASSKDIDFLEHLVDSYFVKLLLQENLCELRELQRDFSNINYTCATLHKRIQLHLKHLNDLVKEPFKFDSYIFRAEHENLEDDILDFKASTKSVRQIVFQITKDILINEKPKYIWKYN